MADNTSTSSIDGRVSMKSDSRYEPRLILERNLQQVLLRAASESSSLTKDVKQALQRMFPNIGSGDRISPDWTNYVHWNAHMYKVEDEEYGPGKS